MIPPYAFMGHQRTELFICSSHLRWLLLTLVHHTEGQTQKARG
jgi:hypothetical protein